MNKRQKLKALVEEMASLDENAKKENRTLTAEEEKRFAECESEAKNLKAEIEADERSAKLANLGDGNGTDGTQERGGEKPFFMVERSKNGIELRADMTAADGGAALAPEQFVNELIKEVEKEALCYARVKKVPVTGAGSLGLPYEDTDVSDADWTDEVPASEIAADSAWKFGKKQLAPTDLTKLIKISKKLLATSALPIDSLAREKIVQKLTAAFENAIVNGTGVAASGSSAHTQPLGIFVASNDGIPTSRDVETETAGALSANDFINVYMNLRPAYRKGAVWVMSSKALKEAMKLKGLDGQYIWQESLRAGEPSTLLGLPVLESEFAPAGSGTGGAWASGDYAAVLGDLSHYQFAYWKGIDVTIDNYSFAGKNQIGIYGHTLADGQPTLAAAFSRLKIQ